MLTKMLSSGSTDVKFNPPYIKHVRNSLKDNKIPNYKKFGMFRLDSKYDTIRHLNVLLYCVMLLEMLCIPCFLIFVLTYQQANIHLV